VHRNLQTFSLNYAQVSELLGICREYITAIRIKNANSKSVGTRQMELSAYFTHCTLQPIHLALALNLAMSQAFKGGNFINAASFAHRILELPDVITSKGDMRAKAMFVVKKSEEKARNEHKLQYDERNPFTVECLELVPIYKGTPSSRCSFCGSTYFPHAKGTVCVTCNLSVIGVETIGLVSQSPGKH